MRTLIVSVSLAFAAGSALAHGCPGEMAKIDARLATKPQMSKVDLDKVAKLRADGETAHKAGKHDDSMKALGEAKKLLGI